MQTNLIGSFAHITTTEKIATTVEGCFACNSDAEPYEHNDHHRRIIHFACTPREIVAGAPVDSAFEFLLSTPAGVLVQKDTANLRLCAPERCTYCDHRIAVWPYEQQYLDAGNQP